MGKINVKFGQLTKPLQSVRIIEGTVLESFCKSQGLEYGSSIRVNGQTAGRRQMLRPNDIITSIDDVDGG
ncbi:hypothetical protein LCGC14_2520680 [marine sediment metagenome]|uniref:RNA-binding S4 domain-containing protein n=1 Tax=marine sediment metagenome TaxID=412755 RepID=A0A0F9DPS4_9ZZZZ